MQQRGSNTTMENGSESKSRGRVLVRSHAMREEASPPREPSPNMISPSIMVIPSPETSPTMTCANPMVVLSPSLSRVASPCRTPPSCVSPTSTLVVSPTLENEEDDENAPSPKHLNKLNKQNSEKHLKRDASHNKKKILCDCSNQNCHQCTRNNNNHSNFNNNVVQSSNTLTVNRVNSRGKLKQQSSSQGSFENNSPCLSRDSSAEQYTDTSGIDLEQFICETLNRNLKDRALMLRIENDLVTLAKDKSRTHFKFPQMSSYQRMLVHRCAAYFGMDHNIESSGKCVVVNKTKNTRIPETCFKEYIKGDIIFSEEPRKSILKRDNDSSEDYSFKSPDRQSSLESRRSKSIEERAEEYEKARKRIFDRELLRQMRDSSDFVEWSEGAWSSTDSENSRFRLQLPDHSRRYTGKLIKVQSEETGETLRPYVAKSYSFGGYGGTLNRGDSVISTHSAGPRLLTKQDSAASSASWRLSPSSSGYKSQSQMSESVTPSPTSTPHPIHSDSSCRQDSNCSDNGQCEKEDARVLWAVTDIQSVPKGSMIIDPKTGETVRNEDGSVYHYDPNNLPAGYTVSSKPPPSPKKSLQQRKDGSESPKKKSSKYSPSHKTRVIHSSTSPSLPYSPPLPQNRGFQFVPPLGDGIPPQQYPIFGSQAYQPGPEPSIPMYQQPCIVYTTPFGMPVSPHFEGRIDPPTLNEITGSTYYMTENSPPTPQSLPYQQPPTQYWSQPPMSFYQTPQTPTPTAPQRFPLPIHPQNQTGYISSFPQNYLPSHNPGPPPNTDLLSMYPQMQMVYQQNQTTPVMYPNQSSILYAQNPVFAPSTPLYQSQSIPPYPQNTSTPNSCTSSSMTFTNHEQSQQSVMQLTQNMAQMNFGPANHPNFLANKMVPPYFDVIPKACTPKSNRFNGAKNFILSSSQSSTGTNSPASTVIAGYCPQTSGMYRTPPETPPSQLCYGPGFPVAPVLFRQMSNVRAPTPARSSRSPTPASEISHYERQRIPLPTTLYHGMPYVLQSDNRVIPGRGQPNAYRNPAPLKFQQDINKKNRKSNFRANKSTGMPPNNGKPF